MTRWFDALRYQPPKGDAVTSSPGLSVTYNPANGPAEAMLSTLLLTWPEGSRALALPNLQTTLEGVEGK